MGTAEKKKNTRKRSRPEIGGRRVVSAPTKPKEFIIFYDPFDVRMYIGVHRDGHETYNI